MKLNRTIAALLSRAVLPVGVAASLLACKGPQRDERVVPIDLPDQAPMVVQWVDGPRKDNAEREMEKQAQRAAAGLFQAEPMAREVAVPEGAAPEAAPTNPVGAAPAGPDRPAWADGVEQPADAGGNDLPQGFPIEVKRGETPAVLGEWANIDPKDLVTGNLEALGGRKWFKVGDRIVVTMSANEKVAFDRKREAFQKGRVDAFFANRYFEKVIVYRVKKGEFIASAAKRYGDVPLWLIEEFNQMDFRGLQPGDEILIPVVGELPPGVRQPPPPVVVDEEGHALSEAHSDAVEPRLRGEIFAKARMALDDSNVFKRPRNGSDNLAMAPQGVAPGGVADPMVAPIEAANYPRPEQVLPPASIGGGLLPNYVGAPVNQPGQPAPAQPSPATPFSGQSPFSGQVVQGPGVSNNGVVVGVSPAAPAQQPDKQTPRDVIVRRGESLMHYVMWSKTPLDQIKTANQGRLDTDRIFIGARIAIPMSDEQYVQFVTARAEWDKQKLEGDKAGDDKASGDKAGKGDKAGASEKGDKAAKGDKAGKPDKAAKVKRHTVKSGETATSIARSYRINVKDLKTANPGVDLKKLKVGSKLVVPAKAK